MYALDSCIVAILNPQGGIVGTGFVVNEQFIVTCAHVVMQAGFLPGDHLSIRYHISGISQEAFVLPEYWREVEKEDLAYLELANPLPEGVQPVSLGEARGSEGNPFISFGYPVLGDYIGIPARGSIERLVSKANDQKMVQLTSSQLAQGHSGAPVFDEERQKVVGMVSEVWHPGGDTKNRDTAFALPADLLKEVYPELVLSPYVSPAQGPAYLAPFQAPPLPEHYVPRPEVSEGLKSRLILKDNIEPGVFVVSAIHGLGGIGKSVLATALAYDPDVKDRFPDGILWVTLGQNPELLSLLSSWIVSFGDYDFRPTTIISATAHLRTLLQKKAVLLVVDDVWDPEHVPPFLVGSSASQMIITTRRADVADEIGAELYQLDVMTEEQSLSLLESRVGYPLSMEEKEDAKNLAMVVGYLPLALELAASRVRRGSVDWKSLHAALDSEIARLEELESFRGRHKRLTRLEASFNLSLEALRQDYEDAWKDFIWLGILPEDVTITPPMATTLWSKAIDHAESMLDLLWNDALLLSGSPSLIGDVEWRGYRIHDLLHDIARKLLVSEAPKGLGFTLENAHKALLNRYKTKASRELWHTIQDDGYIYNNIIWHMEHTGQTESVHALMEEQTPKGGNGWFEAREKTGQIAGYLADVSRVWGLSNKGYLISKEKISIGKLCRYGLIFASLNSLAKNLSPIVLKTTVEKGVWPPAQGLAYARQVPEPSKRAELILQLLPCLPEGTREEGLKDIIISAKEADSTGNKSEALIRLPLELAESGYYENAFWVIRGFGWDVDKVEALIRMIPVIGAREFAHVLDILRGFTFNHQLVRVIQEIALYLPQHLLAEMVSFAGQITTPIHKAAALASLSPHLDPDSLLEVFRIVQDIVDMDARFLLLKSISAHLPEPQKQQALDRVLALAIKIRATSKREEALVDVVEVLAQAGDVASALYVTSKELLENNDLRIEALGRLAPFVGDADFRQYLKLVKGQYSFSNRAKILIPAVSHFSLTQIDHFMDQIDDLFEYKYWRSKVYAALVLRLAALGKMDDAMVELRNLLTPGDLASTLIQLLPGLQEKPKERDEAIELVIRLADNDLKQSDRSVIKVELASVLVRIGLPELAVSTVRDEKFFISVDKLRMLALEMGNYGFYEWAIELARMSRDPNFYNSFLTDLVKDLPDKLSFENQGLLLEAAKMITWNSTRAKAILKLFPHLSDNLRGGAIQLAISSARGINNDIERSETLALVAQNTPEPAGSGVAKEALDNIWGVRDIDQRTDVIVKSVLELAKTEDPLGGLDVIYSIDDPYRRSEALTNLIPFLPEERVHEAFDKVLSDLDEFWFTEDAPHILLKLVQVVPDSSRDEVIDLTIRRLNEVENTDERVDFWLRLIPMMDEAWLDLVLENNRDLASLDSYSDILGGLIKRYAKLDLLDDGLALVDLIQPLEERAYLLAYMSDLAQGPVGGEIFERSLLNIRKIWDEEILVKTVIRMLPYLEAPFDQRAIAIAYDSAMTVHPKSQRNELLVSLVPFLSEEDQMQTVPIMEEYIFDLDDSIDLHRYVSDDTIEEIARVEIELARGIPIPLWRAEKLGRLIPKLKEPLRGIVFREAFESITQINVFDGDNLDRLVEFFIQLIRYGYSEEIGVCLQGESFENSRSLILAQLAPHFSETMLENACKMIMEEKEPVQRSKALVALASNVSDEWMEEIVDHVLKTLSDVEDRGVKIGLLLKLSNDLLLREVREEVLYPVFYEALYISSTQDREDLLMSMGALVPTISALGGPDALLECIQAVDDVGRWWP